MAFLGNAGQIGIAPELGADNDEVLADLGYTPAQIDDPDAKSSDGTAGPYAGSWLGSKARPLRIEKIQAIGQL